MFSKTFCTLLSILFFFAIKAQKLELEWIAEYPNVSNQFAGILDQRLLVADDKSVVICRGNVNSSVATSFLFLKYDSLGLFQWKAEYDTQYADDLYGCTLAETGLIAAGVSSGPPFAGQAQAILLSYDKNGDQRYQVSIYNTQTYSSGLNKIGTDSDGYLYAFGSVCEFPCDGLDPIYRIFIAKVDPINGEVLWKKEGRRGNVGRARIVGDKIRTFETVFEVPDSVYMFGLYEYDLNGIKLDSLYFPNWTGASSLLLDNNGDMVVVDDLICSINILGDTTWCYDYLEATPDFIGEVRHLVADEFNNIYCTGWFRDNTNAVSYAKTVKIASDGTLIWENKSHYADSVSYEEGLSISIGGNYVFVGANAYFGPDNSLTSDFRPILYSKEDGSILSDTLIHFTDNETVQNSAWDGEHFYLYGTYLSNGDPDKPHTVVLFKFGIDEPVTTKEPTAINEISAYPSPFQSTFDLKIISSQHGSATIAMFNALGQQLLGKEDTLVSGENRVRIAETNQWASGVYFVAITFGGHTYFEKVVKGDD